MYCTDFIYIFVYFDRKNLGVLKGVQVLSTPNDDITCIQEICIGNLNQGTSLLGLSYSID